MRLSSRIQNALFRWQMSLLMLIQPGLLTMFIEGQITFDQLLRILDDVKQVLEIPEVCTMFIERQITFEQLLQLSVHLRQALEIPGFRTMLTEGQITFYQILRLIDNEINALRDRETRQRVINGRLTINDMMGGQAYHANGTAEDASNINDNQSTHNTSVHRAVSESATRLVTRYQLMIDGEGLESVILMIQSGVDRFSNDSEKNQAAKRCIKRITKQSYTFTDRSSQITTRQLLALTFLAICDSGNRVGTPEDARTQFVEGLYEIQRGYNLSNTGVDQGGQDRPICSAGTFNKLIEKLQGIHPDCQILFITRQTASLKLPIVVREEAMCYVKLLANPNTVQEFRAFSQLVSQVKEDGVEVIWDQIKGNVANRMFDEFGSLYRDREDHSFTGLIEAGVHTELHDLEIFQFGLGTLLFAALKIIKSSTRSLMLPILALVIGSLIAHSLKRDQSSEGYHQFCSQMLRQSNMFLTHRTSSEYPSEHRHDSTEVPMQYD